MRRREFITAFGGCRGVAARGACAAAGGQTGSVGLSCLGQSSYGPTRLLHFADELA